MTKLCIKILVESDSAIESAFPWDFTLAKSQAAVAPTFPSYREADMRSPVSFPKGGYDYEKVCMHCMRMDLR